jgi:inner membrane protein
MMSERAVKYGVLFVVLVFTSFFMFEVLSNLRIHPMQYLLVGLAMAVFFLLIISLSEHIPFLTSYIISGVACVALIGIYLAGVLKNRKTAAAFSGCIALLYAVLYGVLQSEDNALLMGALLMFLALTAVMVLTRRMDWYQLNQIAESNGQSDIAARKFF